MDLIFYVLPALCVSAVIGYFIGNVRGEGASGAIWGLLLGPVGWLLVLSFDDRRRKCPLCAGVLPEAKVLRCMHCGGDISQVTALPQSRPPSRPTGGAQGLRPPPARNRRK